MAKRVRYNRGSIDSAIAAAKRLDTKPVYIEPTAGGLVISYKKPYWVRYYKVDENNHVQLCLGNY